MLVSAKTGEGLEGLLERIYEEIIKKIKKFNNQKKNYIKPKTSTRA